jgi:c-di-GMP-related signal transduction protein
MHQTNFIVREPLLDPQQRVIGYELCWQQGGRPSAMPTSKR